MERSYSLSQIAEALSGELVNVSDPSVMITDFTPDSRKVAPGSLFVAYQGVAVDGHDFLDKAVEGGASAVLVTDRERLGSHPGIVVEESRRALSQLAHFWNGNPTERLLCVGVTGTNGKTSVHWLVHHALNQLGKPGVLVGTLGIFHQDDEYNNDAVTTPSASVLHHALGDAVAKGAQSCSIEVSSHGVEQHRITDMLFDVGIFLNLTPDHLDYHKTVEAYFEAKLDLFRLLGEQHRNGPKSPTAVVNLDCPYGARVVDTARSEGLSVLTFGFVDETDLHARSFTQDFHGSTLVLEYEGEELRVTSPLVGEFNGSNLTAAFAALLACGYEAQQIAEVLSSLSVVPGRLERVPSTRGAVFIDYAHAPDALRSALSTVRPLVRNNLWVVFGCGGDRDPLRRVGMGKAAHELADKVVITSDNPRSEDPQTIVDQIYEHCPSAVHCETDRRKAIDYVLSRMEEGDIVVVAGKGHEPYQEIAGETFHFSDMEEVTASLQQLGLFQSEAGASAA